MIAYSDVLALVYSQSRLGIEHAVSVPAHDFDIVCEKTILAYIYIIK